MSFSDVSCSSPSSSSGSGSGLIGFEESYISQKAQDNETDEEEEEEAARGVAALLGSQKLEYKTAERKGAKTEQEKQGKMGNLGRSSRKDKETGRERRSKDWEREKGGHALELGLVWGSCPSSKWERKG